MFGVVAGGVVSLVIFALIGRLVALMSIYLTANARAPDGGRLGTILPPGPVAHAAAARYRPPVNSIVVVGRDCARVRTARDRGGRHAGGKPAARQRGRHLLRLDIRRAVRDPAVRLGGASGSSAPWWLRWPPPPARWCRCSTSRFTVVAHRPGARARPRVRRQADRCRGGAEPGSGASLFAGRSPTLALVQRVRPPRPRQSMRYRFRHDRSARPYGGTAMLLSPAACMMTCSLMLVAGAAGSRSRAAKRPPTGPRGRTNARAGAPRRRYRSPDGELAPGGSVPRRLGDRGRRESRASPPPSTSAARAAACGRRSTPGAPGAA